MDIMKNHIIKLPATIVADGDYPSKKIALNVLKKSNFIIACDGAANSLIKKNQKIDLIIGDMDSIKLNIATNKNIKKIHIKDQTENDLRKAINFLTENNIKTFNILGATGKREDHTIGNIFSILELKNNFDATIYTDYGTFKTINKSQKIESKEGQQISFFATDKTIKLKTKGLKYNFNNDSITTMFYGTLNESKDKCIDIKLSHGKILIFQNYL